MIRVILILLILCFNSRLSAQYIDNMPINILNEFPPDYSHATIYMPGVKKVISREVIDSRNKTIFKYNKNGLITERRYVIKYKITKRKLKGGGTYAYATDGDTLFVSCLGDNTHILTTKYIYDRRIGQYVTKLHPTFEAGVPHMVEDFIHEDSLLIRSRYHDEVYEYSYDENRKLLKRTKKEELTAREFPPGSCHIYVKEYKYDVQGRLTDVIDNIEFSDPLTLSVITVGGFKWSENALNKRNLHLYDFDKHGNWTKTCYLNEEGKRGLIKTRRIIYR